MNKVGQEVMNRLTGRKYRIHFKDEQQDCLWWDLDEQGKVIACNLQSNIWAGIEVLNLTELMQSSHTNFAQVKTPIVTTSAVVTIYNGTGKGKEKFLYWKYPVVKIEVKDD